MNISNIISRKDEGDIDLTIIHMCVLPTAEFLNRRAVKNCPVGAELSHAWRN